MKKKIGLESFSISELKCLREKIFNVESKEQAVELIDCIIKTKEDMLSQTMNERFLVDWFNIDQVNISLLHENGIDNLGQLRSMSLEDLRRLGGITKSGFEQISWARDFFDMTPLKDIPSYSDDSMAVAKKIVKHAENVSKKHPNV